MAVIAAHVSAILLHTLTLRDRMIERMTFRFRPADDRSRLG
jgi:cytochrome b561